MREIVHKVKHFKQPTNNTCGYAALATLLSYYGYDTTVEKLLNAVPHPKDEKGNDTGSVTTQLVELAQKLGYKAHMYSFDCLVLDLSWQGLSRRELIKKLEKFRRVGDVKLLGGKHWTKVYIDGYLGMLRAGAKLTVQPYVTTKLLYKLLERGPVYANICSTTRRGKGKTRKLGEDKTVLDDMRGTESNHSIVIYGNDNKGNFLVSDPWDGLIKVEPETMVVVITAAQIQCDNQVFVIESKN